MNKLRILLADDHVMIRDGLKLLVNSQPDMEVVGEAGDGRVALQLAQELLPDVVVKHISTRRSPKRLSATSSADAARAAHPPKRL
jgi:two-component system response regulator NreC